MAGYIIDSRVRPRVAPGDRLIASGILDTGAEFIPYLWVASRDDLSKEVGILTPPVTEGRSPLPCVASPTGSLCVPISKERVPFGIVRFPSSVSLDTAGKCAGALLDALKEQWQGATG